MGTTIRTYSELIALPTFEERFKYLELDGKVAEETFGFDRWVNQEFYKSYYWQRLRDQIIIRDAGCDLAVEGEVIGGPIYIHHMNPIRKNDILDLTEYLLNPEYLICTSYNTHQAIHYGALSLIPRSFNERTPYDTSPWRKGG